MPFVPRQAIVAGVALAVSLLAGPSAAICPVTTAGEASYGEHRGHLDAMLTAKSQHPSYETLQDNGQLCDTLPELYENCNTTMGEIYGEFRPDDQGCAATTNDEAFCELPYTQVVSELCNESGCPVSPREFTELFSMLASCGYLSTVGGVPALESPAAATACLTQQGACKRESSNTLLKYASCKSLVKDLMFIGAPIIGLEEKMPEPDSCITDELLPKERCNAVFGAQVEATYCKDRSSTAGQLMGASVLSSLLGVWVAGLLSL
jgi:hypothetical protein